MSLGCMDAIHAYAGACLPLHPLRVSFQLLQQGTKCLQILELICAAVPAIADDYAADAADYAADDYAADAAGEGDVVGPVCPRRPSCAPPAGAQQRSLESPRRALGSAGA